MTTINEIINEVDRKIRIERTYLQKKHKNGIFDFQTSGIELEPYNVDHERIIYPLVETMLGNNTNIDVIEDVYLLKESKKVYQLRKDYFDTGVLGRTLLLDNNGEFVFTEYYKNILPQSYNLKLNLPEDEVLKLKILNSLSCCESSVNSNYELEMSIHFPDPIRTEMKRLNPGIKFNSKTRLPLEKISKDLSWTEIQTNIKNLIDRLDDTCVNIFNRVDYISFLTQNGSEIQTTVNNLSNEDRNNFRNFHKDNQDWFSLIVEAIDLTQNHYYKNRVNPEKSKQQAKNMQEIMDYMVMNIVVNSAKNNIVKKKKI